MKKVEYVGAGVDCLSRFDKVQKGDILEMYEYEYDCVKDNPDFRNRTPELSSEEREIAQRVKPWACATFDLRTIAWENRNLVKYLTARMSKQMLIKVVNAINQIGGYVELSTVNDSRDLLVDKIVSAARTMGWDKLTIDERQSLPLYADRPIVEVSQEDLDKKTTRQRVRKPVEV